MINAQIYITQVGWNRPTVPVAQSPSDFSVSLSRHERKFCTESESPAGRQFFERLVLEFWGNDPGEKTRPPPGGTDFVSAHTAWEKSLGMIELIVEENALTGKYGSFRDSSCHRLGWILVE